MTTATATAAAQTDAARPDDGPDPFYEKLTARNHGLIDATEQQLLRRAPILVAGCGSIGGAVVEPLVRLGAERLTLAEPDGYDTSNLNRQRATLADVGRNKAVVLAEYARNVNPFADVRVDTDGVTAGNVAEHVTDAALIFDGIDVTSGPALACKHLLHVEARRQAVPVVSGYDIAGVQLVQVYDYRLPRLPVLAGRIRDRDMAEPDPLRFLARVVPLSALPVEIFPELRRQIRGESAGFPQLVYSADLFGVIGTRLALDLLAGRPVRRRITVDVHGLTRPTGPRWRSRMARLVELARMSRVAVAYRR